MAEFQKNRKWRKVMYSRTMLCSLVIVLIFLIASIVKIAPKKIEAARNKENVVRQYETLEEQKLALQSKIDRLNTTEGVEESVRNKFRVVKDGEELVVIVDEPKKEVENTESENKGFWAFLTGLFR